MTTTIGFGNASYAQYVSSQSPVTAVSGDTSDQFVAPNGQTVTVTVKSPVTTRTYYAPAMAAGASPIDYFAQQIANAGSGSTLVIPKGTYNFPAVNCSAVQAFVCNFNTYVLVFGLHDMVIDGQGSTLNFASAITGVDMYNAARVTFQNFSLDYPSLANAAVGTVTAVGGGYYNVQVPAGTTVGGGFNVATLWDSTNNYWNLQSPYPDDYMTSMSPFTISSSGVAQGMPTNGQPVAVGQNLLLRHLGSGQAVLVWNSQDVTFNGVNIYSSPALGFMVTVGRGLHLNNVQVTRSNGRPISTAADAVHFGSYGGDVIIENSTFAYQGDDAINIHTTMLPISAMSCAAGSSCPASLPSYSYASTGDPMALFDQNQRLISIQTASCSGSSCTVNASPIAGTGGFAADLNLVNARYVIQNNTFLHNRARGILAQSPFGLIQGNTFNGQSLFSMFLVTSSFWNEGPGAQNVLIVNNDISGIGNSGFGAITLATENNQGVVYSSAAATTVPPLPGTQQNVVMALNKIHDIPGPAFYISSANNVILASNTTTNTNFANVWGTPNKNYPTVVVDASNIYLSGNSFALPSGKTYPILFDSSDMAVQVH